MDELTTEINAFLSEHGMSASTFGEQVMGDRHLVRHMINGREPRRATVGKVRTFMAEYPPAQAAA